MTMRMTSGLAAMLLTAALLAGCEGDDGNAGPQGAPGPQGPAGTDASRTTIALSFLGRARNPASGFDESAAEIVAYEPASQRLFVVNAQSGNVDIFSLAAPAAPTLADTLEVAADIAAEIGAAATDFGAANSVAVDAASNTVAVAVEADPKTDNGYVAFYQASDGTFLAAVEVGALPDMLIFTPDGSKVVVANEGEPNGAYDVDPEGSVSIIDVSGGASTVTAANVTTVGFGGLMMADIPGVRIFGPGASIAQDLEPEYVAVSADSTTAWVSLQENNAIAEIDLVAGTLTDVWSMGFKNHRIAGNGLDAADNDDIVNIRNWPIFGMFLPDAIASYEFAGTPYLVTANEGDAREYFDDSIADAAACEAAGGFDFDADDGCLVFIDEFDVEDLIDFGVTFALPDADLSFLFDANLDGAVTIDDLNSDASLARYAITSTNGFTGCDPTDAAQFGGDGDANSTCVVEALYGYGARSFSIYNAVTRERVFDSGDDFERITADRLGDGFNSDNDENGTFDSRSDAKGPEPEAVTLAQIEGRTYAFIGLERVGGIMVYDISEPESARFVQYVNSRDFGIADVEDPAVADDIDLGPESSVFIPATDSPTGNALLVIGNEVSGTISVYQVDTLTIGD
ncbi:MAG: choice-of-anchor I family protein [Pseudomonadales bacterium]|nr:choice-of-anchor I family protein [Pseudomonadales bacterium]